MPPNPDDTLPAIHRVRRFRLERLEDPTGISGTGHIADGVVFPDGTVAMRWCTAFRSTGIYESVEDLVAIHGHNGRTVVTYTDE